MLEIRHIHKEYKTGTLVQKALDGVSLSFRENEFVAVLGPSGSGKTTLLNIIGGLDHCDSGELIILKVEEDDDGDTYLCPIEDEDEWNEVGQAFEERLSDMFDIEEEE